MFGTCTSIVDCCVDAAAEAEAATQQVVVAGSRFEHHNQTLQLAQSLIDVRSCRPESRVKLVDKFD